MSDSTTTTTAVEQLYSIYQRQSTGTWKLVATKLSYANAVSTYSDLIKYTRIADVLLTENLPYTVSYSSLTQEYTAVYPTEETTDSDDDTDDTSTGSST